MVGIASFAGMVTTLLITILVPIILAIVLYRHKKYYYFNSHWCAGVFCQPGDFRMPLLSGLALTDFHAKYSSNALYLLLVYALSAGVFERGTLSWLPFLRKNHLNWENAIAFGIGHGGIEALLLAGSNAVNNIVIGFMINNGSYEELIAPALGAQAAEIQDALINTPAPHFFLAGFERLSAMSVHIGLSVLVCLAVLAKKPILLLLAILFHGLVNAPAALMNSLGLNIYLVEGLMLIMAIAAAIFAIKSRQKFASYT
jgi:uncharacterized membrane protein YhfC